MKYKLSGMDRLLIPNLFVGKGSMLQQTTVKEINEKILIRSEEFAEYGLVEKEKCPHCGLGGDGITWDSEKIKTEKEFDLSKVHVQLLKESVDKKDKDGEITQHILETCQRIQKMK